MWIYITVERLCCFIESVQIVNLWFCRLYLLRHSRHSSDIFLGEAMPCTLAVRFLCDCALVPHPTYFCRSHSCMWRSIVVLHNQLVCCDLCVINFSYSIFHEHVTWYFAHKHGNRSLDHFPGPTLGKKSLNRLCYDYMFYVLFCTRCVSNWFVSFAMKVSLRFLMKCVHLAWYRRYDPECRELGVSITQMSEFLFDLDPLNSLSRDDQREMFKHVRSWLCHARTLNICVFSQAHVIVSICCICRVHVEVLCFVYVDKFHVSHILNATIHDESR